MAHISLVLYATSGDIKIVSFGAVFCYRYIYRHVLSFLISLSWLLLGEVGVPFTAWLSVFLGCGMESNILT